MWSKLTSPVTAAQLYGDQEIRLASANTYSHDQRIMSLRDYIDDYMENQPLDAPANETWFLVPFIVLALTLGHALAALRTRWSNCLGACPT